MPTQRLVSTSGGVRKTFTKSVVTQELRKVILARAAAGETNVAIALDLGLGESTIRGIKKREGQSKSDKVLTGAESVAGDSSLRMSSAAENEHVNKPKTNNNEVVVSPENATSSLDVKVGVLNDEVINAASETSTTNSSLENCHVLIEPMDQSISKCGISEEKMTDLTHTSSDIVIKCVIPKRRSASQAGGSRRKPKIVLTKEQKLDIIRRTFAGETNSSVGRLYGLGESTVRHIKKNGDKIRRALLAPQSWGSRVDDTSRTSSASGSGSRCVQVGSEMLDSTMASVEKGLRAYIELEAQTNSVLDDFQLRGKALEIYSRVCTESGEEMPNESVDFTASRTWFSNFTRRWKSEDSVDDPSVQVFLTIRGEEEACCADIESARQYPAHLKGMISEMGLCPQQVFNTVETGLFWKRMPARTCVSLEETAVRGIRLSRDRVSLLLCSNASGDCRMKPLVAYHSPNPRALRGLSKNMLPVHWASHKMARVSGQRFEDWFVNHFAVEAERYCRAKGLEFKVLLLLDDAPCHPRHLDSIHPNIRVRFLPPLTSHLIQPLDQGVKDAFKACYLRRTISQMLQATDHLDSPRSRPTAKEWWDSFNILHAINNIGDAWREVSEVTLRGAWAPVWPDCVRHRDTTKAPFFPPFFFATLQSCVTLGCQIKGEGFSDLNKGDVLQLLDSHEEEMSAQDLLSFKRAGIRGVEDDDDDESVVLRVKDFTTQQLAEFFKVGERLSQMATDMDPSLERSQTFCRSLQALLLPYRDIYADKKKTEKQISVTSTAHPEQTVTVSCEVEESTVCSSSPQPETESQESLENSHSEVASTVSFPISSVVFVDHPY